MSDGKLNRRSLLGLLAAAPVAAVASVLPASARPERIWLTAFNETDLGELVVLSSGDFQPKLYDTGWIELSRPFEGITTAKTASFENHPQPEQPSSADDEGPGAPVAQHDVLPDGCAAASLPGAPAPDPERLADAEAIAAYILHHSGAC